MEITETTQVVFSLGQFLSIAIFIIVQTAIFVGIYWKLNKKIDAVDAKADTVRKESNHQYNIIEKSLTFQEKSFETKCDSIKKESRLVYSSFENVLKTTNETLNELNITVTDLSKLVQDVSKQFGEHKAYHKGKEESKK